MTFFLIYKVILKAKFIAEGGEAGYCPKITSARLPKWYQGIAYIPGQLTQS